MRRLLLVLLALCIAAPAFGQDFVMFKKKVAATGGGGSCPTDPTQSDTSGTGTFKAFDGTNLKVSGTFLTAQEYANGICRLVVGLRRQGSPSMTFDINLYTNSGLDPSALVCNLATGLNAASLGTTFADNTIEVSACDNVLATATVYHIVFENPSGQGDGSNYLGVEVDLVGDRTLRKYVGSSWASEDGSANIYHKLHAAP